MRTILRALTTGKYILLAVVVALTLATASVAVAGSGVGGVFNLGKTNTVNAITKLVGSVTGASLVVDNNSTGTGATALDLQVEPGKTPMKVNSATKVANLNADTVDGKDSTGLGQVWAVVRQDSFTDCTLLRGSGATGTSSNAQNNFCTVHFNKDLTNCAFIASLGEPGAYPGADGRGEIWAFLANSTAIAVRTADSAGGKTADNFHVAAFC